ncbi:major royal jelly protein 1 [Neodiprion pinetum]|uniref:major royal jelly protein 1 n=1 Tax=Neodiprion pinetum TaxID=441929 RepID=UPI001EE017D1|nr:major royal jelly protein 1 [Neodiprion pinetum]
MLRLLAVAFALAAVTTAYDCNRGVEVKSVQWTGGSFEWPCSTTKSIFKNSGRYNTKHVIATRAQIYRDEAFLVLPRYKSGVPVTVAKVSLRSKGCSATLTAFPCWSMQEEGTCSAFQNAVDLFLDPQDILWVLDTGVVMTLEEPVYRCPPKVVAINVKTGKIVKTIDLSGLACSSSRLQYLVVDYSSDGRITLYVSDAAMRAILVYDVTAGRGYRVVLPAAVTSGAARRDVLYLALVRRSDGSSCLVFTYLSSSRMFTIRTEYLRKGSASGKVHDLGPKPATLVILGTDGGAALFFRYEGRSEVYRWDTANCFKQENFQLVYQGSSCLLATQVVVDYKRGRMRVLESNFPDFIQGTVGCGANQALTIMQACS